MADFRRHKFENEAADINEIDDGLMAGISSGLSSSVKKSELESSNSDSQSKLSDEDMTLAPSLQRKACNNVELCDVYAELHREG
ncbi:unnamed protein product [Parnassius apollo]|uniref:(apollo) hypothetical protein n=1 Tax=Parnassius apollo TaxID=110799 RepID=A0A8S3X7X5_PARAO|nr:unnamed protein product [Parnassius apollo]